MSRIYFHSKSDDDEVVRGAERHWAAGICDKIGLGLLDPESYYHKPRILAALRPRLAAEDAAYHSALTMKLRFDRGELETKDGRRIEAFSLILNTALRLGSRPLKLLARLHGQCELHAWVDGPNRQWLASIIDEGRQSGVMRPHMGWEEVATLLRVRDDEPIVTSFSVTEQFPSVSLIHPSLLPKTEDGEIDYDAAYEMENRWDLAMDTLRTKGGGLELRPDDFDDYYFGATNLSAIDIYDHLPDAEPEESDAGSSLRR